jgi:hypothetical protein
MALLLTISLSLMAFCGLWMPATAQTGQSHEPGANKSAQPSVFEVKDRSGAPTITLSALKMFRYSDYFKQDIPAFEGTLKNVSGGRLLRVFINGVVHKKDGSVIHFDLCTACDFEKDSAHEVSYAFGQPTKFYPADFDSVAFTLEKAERLRVEDGFHFSGFVANDEGCFNDYLATKSLMGVMLRKKLDELLKYDCGFIVEKAQEVRLLQKKTFSLGSRKVAAEQIIIWDRLAVLGTTGPDFGRTGWVLLNSLEPGDVLTTEQIGVAEQR